MLRDRKWDPDYTSDDGDTAVRFYTPALSEAVEYVRGTGYFNAGSLARNVRGIEGLLRNKGKMRLLVGCTLKPAEVEAVRRGEDLKKQVERSLCETPLNPLDSDTVSGLELLSWMVATGHMDVKIAVRCDDRGEPVPDSIYHKKVGVVRDQSGDKIAWSGSDNETPNGQAGNSESFNVFTSWDEPTRQRLIATRLEEDWAGRSGRLIIMDVPEAARRELFRHAPPEGQLPARLARQSAVASSDRNTVWSFINQSHKTKNGDMVGLGTAPVEPWPHQVQVFRRLHSTRPTRLLIADEVGLGKTIQAGLFLRQAWLEGRRRILVMAPAALTRQWQKELREKLNLDWPVYDGKNLIWQDTHAKGKNRKESPDNWTAHGPVIVSSQFARRETHTATITATEWDIVVLDEAHYARQAEPNNPKKYTLNRTLKLMQDLKGQTENLILMTATPMQLHPVELYDLLALLGVPQKWSWDNFERFYKVVRDLGVADLPFVCEMFQASESEYGKIDQTKLGVPKLRSDNAIRILEGDGDLKPQNRDYDLMKKALLLSSPVTRLVSRNTRKQLREYIKTNGLDWRLGTRVVDDEFVPMSDGEDKIYHTMSNYISEIWKTPNMANRAAVGFALTIYRKRLTSSLAALKATLENHLERLDGKTHTSTLHEDEYDDKDADDIAEDEEEALKNLDRETVYQLLDTIRDLPPDTKLNKLTGVIKDLRAQGYKQVMLFTQFTDTMDFLREHLKHDWGVMCYSGRHGEAPRDGGWKPLTRDETKARFLGGSVDVLICTDAAAEGLNFQFCGAMINYDMPWNPMRVEQRIGRIDRIGQQYESIRIVNMYYEGTIEAKIYRALRERINLFEDVVGSLQPILANLEDIITTEALDGDVIFQNAQRQMDETRTDSGLDLDTILAAETTQYEPPESPVMMEDLDRVAGNTDLMRPYKVEQTKRGQYNLTHPTGKSVRITTDREQFEKGGDSMEFWSPGSPAFPEPDLPYEISKHEALKQLLDSMERRR